ncbi:MAG: hypothetical protein MZW92_79300 [Comamonadaceae bacterium]|nr:hypothetical protein [Comamonadaceae bacterium]
MTLDEVHRADRASIRGSSRRSRSSSTSRSALAARAAARRSTRDELRDAQAQGLLRPPAGRRCSARPRPTVRARAPRARRAPGLQARRHLRRRVRDATPPYLYSTYEEECEAEPTDRQEDHGPGRRPEPHRPGHRVRLLLRARRARAARGRLRDHHGQLQPGDRLDRLRHLRPPVLRAADARGRAGDRRHARSPSA